MTNKRNLMLVSSLVSAPSSQPRSPDRGPAGTVTLSRPDYDRLIDLRASASPTGRPALASALTRADVRVRRRGVVRRR